MTDASAPRSERPVLWGAVLAAALTVVLVAWFGRACWGGWWIADTSRTADTYLLATIYDRWAAQVAGGHLPLWFHEFTGGYPVHAAWMYGLFYPPLAAFLALPGEVAWTWLAILHVVFGAVGMYAFLWDERRDPAAAASGAIVFALSGFMLGRIACGHLNLVMPFAWTPWVLLHTVRTVRGERRATAWLAVCGGLGLLSGHVQIWFYAAPLIASYACLEAGRTGRLRAAMPRLLVGAALALGIAAIQWLPAGELFSVSGHPAESLNLVRACSVPPAELLAQLAPRLRASSDEFRHEFVGLAGPLAVIAALLAWKRDARRLFWFVVLASGLVLAMGVRNEVSALANELPPFRFARAPGRAMSLVVFGASVLAGQLVADWFRDSRPAVRILVPSAFAASALFLGTRAPDVVRTDFLQFDWTSQLPPGVRDHRVHVKDVRYPYPERHGVRTMRDVCPLDTPGYRAFTEGVPPGVTAWWFDVVAQIAVPREAPPLDLGATQALVARTEVRAFKPPGGVQCFARAQSLPDDEALARLKMGDRGLFVPPADADGRSATGIDDTPPGVTVDWRTAPDRIGVRLARPFAGYVFLADKWYPGWRVEGDVKARPVRANVAFLTVRTDAADGTDITLAYRPWWRVPALVASGVSLAVAAFLAVPRTGRLLQTSDA